MVKTLVALLVVGVVGVSSEPQFIVPSSTPLTYLGVPQSAPVLYNNPFPFRTAFDIFQGGYAPYYNYPAATFFHRGVPVVYQPSNAVLTGIPTVRVEEVPTVVAAAPEAVAVEAAPQPLETGNAVEVGLEEEVDSPSIITVKEVPSSLPDIVRPIDKFRGVPVPVIPAGIASATQPRFTQTLFQNSKLAPGFRFVSNSKVSGVLRGLQEDSAGIIRT